MRAYPLHGTDWEVVETVELPDEAPTIVTYGGRTFVGVLAAGDPSDIPVYVEVVPCPVPTPGLDSDPTGLTVHEVGTIAELGDLEAAILTGPREALRAVGALLGSTVRLVEVAP